MVRVLIVLAVLAVMFWIVSIVDCAAQPPTRHRGVSKVAWVFVVLLLPVIGGILWFVIGRTGKRAVVVSRAPDDDPEFLKLLGSPSDQDERIRRLEEELAQLDSEDEDPRWLRPPAPGAETPDTDGEGPRRGALG